MTIKIEPNFIRPLDIADTEAYRTLRLQALQSTPEAFGSSYEEEAAYASEQFSARVMQKDGNIIFGCLAGTELVGMAGFVACKPIKTRHKGILWGVFLHKEWRGRGLDDALVQKVIDHASTRVSVLLATVVSDNEKAKATYQRLGFVSYGTEKQAICVNGTFYDEALLALNLRNRLKLTQSHVKNPAP